MVGSRPEVTLIVSSSVDGCLIGHDSENFDPNPHWKDTPKIRGRVHQFFDFSAENQDAFNLVMADTLVDIEANNPGFIPKKNNINLIVLDPEKKLTAAGLKNLAQSVKQLIVIMPTGSSGEVMPANCRLFHFSPPWELPNILRTLRRECAVEKITIPSANLMNGRWLATGMVDYLTVILHPLIVGNNGSATFAWNPDGVLHFFPIQDLQLISVQSFDTDYVFVRYKVRRL